jgi:seryl-tRNA synthetase
MLDINLIREKPDWVKEQIRKLNDLAAAERIDNVLELDQNRRAFITEVEAFKAYRNKLSKSIGQLRGNKKLDLATKTATARALMAAFEADDYEKAVAIFENPPDGSGISADEATEAIFQATMNDLFAQMKTLGDRIGALDEKIREADEQLHEHMLWIPNLPHESVPVAESEAENIAHPTQGQMRSYDFTPQAHWDLGPALGIIDFERGVKLGGTRFYILAGMGARLQRALINFLLDELVNVWGFEEMYVPLMVKEEAMYGSGQFPKFIDTSYRVEDAETYMLPTAEVAIANMLAGEILDAGQLPLSFVGHTPCFRREKMSAGRDVRGIKRVHQFEKVEMFKFTTPEASYEALDEMIEIAESLCAKLKIPHRRLEIVTGDLGFTATKKFDIEMWSPGCEEWLEVSSCSNTEDFQARRANIRYRPTEGKSNRFIHMLNGSALGVPRTLIAIMENYQTADGCIRIPTVLQPYLGGIEVIEPQ